MILEFDDCVSVVVLVVEVSKQNFEGCKYPLRKVLSSEGHAIEKLVDLQVEFEVTAFGVSKGESGDFTIALEPCPKFFRAGVNGVSVDPEVVLVVNENRTVGRPRPTTHLCSDDGLQLIDEPLKFGLRI